MLSNIGGLSADPRSEFTNNPNPIDFGKNISEE